MIHPFKRMIQHLGLHGVHGSGWRDVNLPFRAISRLTCLSSVQQKIKLGHVTCAPAEQSRSNVAQKAAEQLRNHSATQLTGRFIHVPRRQHCTAHAETRCPTLKAGFYIVQLEADTHAEKQGTKLEMYVCFFFFFFLNISVERSHIMQSSPAGLSYLFSVSLLNCTGGSHHFIILIILSGGWLKAQSVRFSALVARKHIASIMLMPIPVS